MEVYPGINIQKGAESHLFSLENDLHMVGIHIYPMVDDCYFDLSWLKYAMVVFKYQMFMKWQVQSSYYSTIAL